MLQPFSPRSEIDLDKIAQSGQCFRWEKTAPQSYIIPAFGRALNIKREENGALSADCSQEDWEALWLPYFDSGYDYEKTRRAIPAGDAYLSAAAQAGRGIVILNQEPFETLISFIVSQNNNIPRIRRLLCALCLETAPAFPTPEALALRTEESLRAMGFGYRAPYLLAASRFYLENSGALAAMPTDALIKRLMRCQGVGPKVAACVALFGYGKKDAFPIDTWVKKILAAHYRADFEFCPDQGVYQQWMFYYERLNSH